jgi:hypothetical protein
LDFCEGTPVLLEPEPEALLGEADPDENPCDCPALLVWPLDPLPLPELGPD